MTREEFAAKRIEGRDRLLKKIVKKFKGLNPVAIHLFGSGVKGFKDEFSDIDIWITFKDGGADRAQRELPFVFGEIAPVLVKHHSKTWSPIEGASYSVIHETRSGLFVVDYYVSKLSKTVLPRESRVLYGDDSLVRGEWKLNRHVNEKMKDSHTCKKDVDLLINLIFTSFKGIVRKWNDGGFLNTLKAVHKGFRERYPGKLKPRRISLSFSSGYKLMSDLYRISNKRQKRAIGKIREHAERVEELYLLGGH